MRESEQKRGHSNRIKMKLSNCLLCNLAICLMKERRERMRESEQKRGQSNEDKKEMIQLPAV